MLVIGDELLGGHVTDANSPWLAGRLHAHGVPFTRIHVVPDEMAAIDEALTTELARARPRLVFTSGGIGSTPDDITYEAVAASLGRGLVEHPHLATRMDEILERTRNRGFEVDATYEHAIRRMSHVPDGSRILMLEGAWLPAVVVDVDGGCDAGGASVVVLPGVPVAFRTLITEAVEPQLIAGRNTLPATVEIRHDFPESLLNATFAHLIEATPQVKLGSYPGRPSLVRLTGPDAQVDQAKELVEAAIDRLATSEAGRQYLAEHAADRDEPRRDNPQQSEGQQSEGAARRDGPGRHGAPTTSTRGEATSGTRGEAT
ncbi:MAG: molybdopterin-binding protein [Nitriliruptoraceae bacterium]